MSAINLHDPAPSRLKYRLERLMLTPVFRLILRVGLPMALSFGAATWWLSYEDNREAFVDLVAELRAEVEQRPEFMVNLMVIDGASTSVAEDIREVISLDFPISSFDLDLKVMRETIVGLDAVRTARLRIAQGGVLQVDVAERVPAVVWRHSDGLELLDPAGEMVGPLTSRELRPELPLIAGKGADKAVSEAIALLAAAAPLEGRLRGLVRVGERRWDLVLDQNQKILLPEDNAVLALERVMAKDEAIGVFNRDIAQVDLRLPDRPTVRMTERAAKHLWTAKAEKLGEQQE